MRRIEYGGELFGMSANHPFTGADQKLIPPDWQLYRSGRDALRAFVRLADRKRVLMPALCCSSMVLPFRQSGWEVAFYRLKPDLSADEEDVSGKLRNDDVLLYMRYFGIRPFSDAFLEGLRSSRRNILFLEDRTHDIWMEHIDTDFRPDAVAASLRKWAALPEGGMLRTDLGTYPAETDTRYGDLRFDAMEKKSRYLETGDERLNQDAREAYSRAEQLLDISAEPVRMAPQYEALLRGLDFTAILETRRRNLRRLLEKLTPLSGDGTVRLMTDTPENSGLYLPILIDNRDSVQRELIRRRVYCPAAIWPEPPEAAGVCPVSHYVTEHMLSILCDQRYTESDMDYLTDNLIDILKTGGSPT